MDQPDTASLLVAALESRPDKWTTWKQINSFILRETGTRFGRRQIAAAAEASGGEMISSTRGYRLAKHAGEQDILTAYRQRMRMAIGTEQRARQMIANARRTGRLHDLDEARIRREITEEFSTGKDPATHAIQHPPKPPTQQDLF